MDHTLHPSHVKTMDHTLQPSHVKTMERTLHYTQQIRYYQNMLEACGGDQTLFHKQQLRYHQEKLEECFSAPAFRYAQEQEKHEHPQEDTTVQPNPKNADEPENNPLSVLDSYMKCDETITERMGQRNAQAALEHDAAYMKAFNAKKEKLMSRGMTAKEAEKAINDKVNKALYPHMTKPVKNPLLLFQEEESVKGDEEDDDAEIAVAADD